MSRARVRESGPIATGAALALHGARMPRRTMFDAGAIAGLVRTTIEHAGPGPVMADVPVGWRAAGPTVADAVRACGVVPVRPLEARVDAAGLEGLRHRHVALLVTSGPDARRAAAWVKWLARASPRGHVVLRFAGSTAAVGTNRAQRSSGSQRDRKYAADAADDRRLARLIAAAEFERADAWLATLGVEAKLFGRPCRDGTLRLRVWLRLWQGRHEEAEAACGQMCHSAERRLLEAVVAWATCRDVPHLGRVAVRRWRAIGADAEFLSCLRIASQIAAGAVGRAREGLQALASRSPATPLARLARSQVVSLFGQARTRGPERTLLSSLPSAPGLSRWKHGAIAMYLLPAVPALLHLLADADDELTALRDAAAWGQEHAGARGVAFVGGHDGRLGAAVGWGGQSPSPADRIIAVNANAAECHPRGPSTLAVAPVRHAGAHIGSVLVLGPSERAGTLLEAATMLALLCPSVLRLRLDQLAKGQQGRILLPEIIGDSPAASAIRDAIARAATTPFAVLVEGESGTGKELVARALHRLSPRRDRRMVAVNCAALSDDLVEAELFGHTRGAFTGAVAPRAGLFEDAHGGTLFLDEVAELSARAQAKLLRVLQEREVRRVGENMPRPIDVRVVAATNRPLVDACAGGHFREDLLFRLAVVRIRLAPLRERAEDIAPIARSLWTKTMGEVGKRAVVGADALARLAAHHWPGNVRELQNVVAGLAMVAPARGRVSARHVDLVLSTTGTARHAPPMSLDRARRACERQTVVAALARHAGRRSAAARELGLTRQGLAKIIRRLHIGDAAIEGVA